MGKDLEKGLLGGTEQTVRAGEEISDIGAPCIPNVFLHKHPLIVGSPLHSSTCLHASYIFLPLIHPLIIYSSLFPYIHLSTHSLVHLSAHYPTIHPPIHPPMPPPSNATIEIAHVLS